MRINTENLKGIADYLLEIGVSKISLLPYNPTWYPKNAKIGIANPKMLKKKLTWQSKDKIAACEKIFVDRGISIV